jgi:DNA-directed RNA polymerase specialized sigma24 family protein
MQTNACPHSIDAYVDASITTVAANLVKSRAITPADREDLEQDLRLAVLSSAANYDPDKASWHTYANRVVLRAVKMHLRGRYAACRDPRKCVRFQTDTSERGQNTGPSYTNIPDLHHDDLQRQRERSEEIRVVVDGLPDDQQQLAKALMEFPSGKARAFLGWGKDRFYAVRRELTAALEDAELATC